MTTLRESFCLILIAAIIFGCSPRGSKDNPILLYDSSQLPYVFYRPDSGSLGEINLQTEYDNMFGKIRNDFAKATGHTLQFPCGTPKRDTIRIHDTVYLRKDQIDTMYNFMGPGHKTDTIIFAKP